MCAGRCREPRCIRSPCRGSQRLRRALGGTRILLAAAPTAPPCFCRWQRSSLLHRGFFPRRTIRRVDAVRIHPCSPFSRQIKQKLRYPLDTGVLGGRGWIARAAHLKKPRRGFFAAGTDSGGRCCSNPPATIPLICFYKTETPAPGSDTGVLGGAKQPKSEPLPSGASLAAISSKVMVFVPSL